MATIYIDNRPYEVNPEENLLHECLSLGFNLPYFCWHPAMGSVGACRQCAVKQFKDEKDTHGRIVMACMTPAAHGTRISIDDPDAKAFRKGVIEWLMLNHPHDCPVCDEGGECHLQDMTVMAGHVNRRTRFRKRTYRNQYLGPFIDHEMNRCIQCYRCVRYYRDYAGGRDFDVFAAHDSVYFGRHKEGALENEFSGNLVEVCPTGVFTDKTLGRHYTRKWDLQDAPSICVHCGLGCNTSPRARYGMLRRIVNRFNFEINGYFLCDRGRFGYEFVNSTRRIRRPYIRKKKNSPLVPVSRQSLLEELGSILRKGAGVIGVGSPRASLEANFALRSLVGEDNFFNGLPSGEAALLLTIADILRKGPADTASLQDAETSDAVLVLGEDLTNTAPRLALALRQSSRRKPMEIAAKLKIPGWHDYAVRDAIQNEKGPLMIAAPDTTSLDDAAEIAHRAAPQDLARLGFSIAHILDPGAPGVPGETEQERDLALGIARRLAEARRPLIVSGTGCGMPEVIEAAASVSYALEKAHTAEKVRICFSVPECNSLGLILLEQKSLEDAMHYASAGLDAIVVLENDLYRRAQAHEVEKFFGGAAIVVLDSLENGTTSKADALLCTGTFAESEGTLVNNEGRAQRFFKVQPPEEDVLESWRWLRDTMIAAGRLKPGAWRSLDDVIEALATERPDFRHISEAAPPASYRIAGQKIPRQPHRFSGRTAMSADISVHEPPPAIDRDSPLSFSMEGYQGPPPAGLASFFWAPGWNSCQAVNKYQEKIGGPLRGGPAGEKLIRGNSGAKFRYPAAAPGPFKRRGQEFLIIPAQKIFGSEELSMYAPGIAERSAKLHLRINAADALDLGIPAGKTVKITLGGKILKMPVEAVSSLPRGTAALPAGLRETAGIELPAWASIHPV